ncbi:VCBS repeat-containing protein [Streptomyces sp. NBC_00250]|uniref:FG-GAP repeat domain-containing protein n=1 Tax=Streptomyces sp. NBC_00250 TaxID=2903641 RepID=UPI002E2CDC94|nr:VCBS repeat-containing protein [Streptomyces sp. NBC_00250]
MKHSSPAGKRLTVAVTVALAVTGGGLTSGPALASVPSALMVTADDAPSAPAVIDPASALRGWGPSGFLSRVGESNEVPTYRWTRYADGVTTTLPATTTYYRASVGGDVVVRPEGTTYHLYDMAAGGEPVSIDTASLGASATLSWVADRTLVMRTDDGSGRTTLHLVSKPQGEVVDLVVTGLPADAKVAFSSLAAPGLLAVSYTGTVRGVAGKRLAVVDLAEGRVVDDRPVPVIDPLSGIAVSATHVAWVERPSEGETVVVTARRGSDAAPHRMTHRGQDRGVSVFLLGGWVLFGVPGGSTAQGPNPLHALQAVPVDGGTRPFVLLDSLVTGYGTPDTLLVQGGTDAQGEGVYRIVLGSDGKPLATRLATTGLRTTLGVVEESVPAVADFSAPGSTVRFDWYLGRGRAVAELVIIEYATNHTWSQRVHVEDRLSSDRFGRVTLDWNGLSNSQLSAPSGSYIWRLTASPFNGIGPVLQRTGTLKVTNKAVQHDYSGSAFPDLLVRNANGDLHSYDTRQVLFDPGYGYQWDGTYRGRGWNAYDRILATGNLDSTPHSDLVARDRTGVLWFYSNEGGTLAKRTSIGGGWNAYDELAAGSDLTGDGRPDLVATDRSGVLWLYKATGSANKPFTARKRIGGGWDAYNNVTAPGNLGGGTTGDLLARDKDGVLWLYLGKGDGTFAPRTKIGAGWGRMEHLVPIGDFGRDGRPDLLTSQIDRDGRTVFLRYKGTGNWRAPFEKAVTTPVDPLLYGFDLLS